MTETKAAKPFLKWAGGKTHLVPTFENILPNDLTQTNFTYIEPFVGSGAILFWMLNNFPKIKKAVINDINEDKYVQNNCLKAARTDFNPGDNSE